jgi:hypothetical protein
MGHAAAARAAPRRRVHRRLLERAQADALARRLGDALEVRHADAPRLAQHRAGDERPTAGWVDPDGRPSTGPQQRIAATGIIVAVH